MEMRMVITLVSKTLFLTMPDGIRSRLSCYGSWYFLLLFEEVCYHYIRIMMAEMESPVHDISISFVVIIRIPIEAYLANTLSSRGSVLLNSRTGL